MGLLPWTIFESSLANLTALDYSMYQHQHTIGIVDVLTTVVYKIFTFLLFSIKMQG